MVKKQKIKLQTIYIKIASLFFGFLLLASGILFILYADLGLGPWDVFHMGVSLNTSLTFGQVIQVTGFILLIICHYLDQTPGIGSILNMIFVGLFVDLLEITGVYATPENLILKFLMLFLGIFLMGWGSFFCLSAQLGAGPRDSLMVALVKLMNKPVWLIRGSIEFSALLVGAILGGPVGIGTIIVASTIGSSVQFAFSVGGYNAKARHSSLKEQVMMLRR